jgi:hypothetical protein
MTDTRTTDRVLLLREAASDCECEANNLLNQAPNMGPTKERSYRRQADECMARSKALRELVAERAADETPALPTAAETACWHGPGFVCPLCHPVLSVMPDSAADTSTGAP